jgi:acyl-CoA thioesterase
MVEDFDSIISWPLAHADGIVLAEGSYPMSWAQGRAVFGGAITGTCVRAARALVPDRTPLTIDCTFLGPVVGGQSAALEARVLRAGKHMTTVEVTLAQGGHACTRTLVSFGVPRASKVALELPHRIVPPLGKDPLPHIEGVTPTFVQHFELTWAVGAYPFTGAREPGLGGHCKHRTRATGIDALVGLLDAWPAPVLPVLTGPAMASTVRWAAHLTAPERFDPLARCFFEARVISARDGYATTLGHLYDGGGQPIAWMEQLVAFFEK